jgi:hypothetical protein
MTSTFHLPRSVNIQSLNWRTTAYGKQPWTHGPVVQFSRSTAHSSSCHVPQVLHCSLATFHNSSRHSQCDCLPPALHFPLHSRLLGLAHCFSALSLRSTFFTNNISYMDSV